MSYESFRLLHCRAPRLDAQIADLAGLPQELHTLVQDVTLDAFDLAITSAIEHHVDFVLLTGQIFSENPPTLRGLVRLRDGINCLLEEEIAVYLSCDDATQNLLRNGNWLSHGDVTLISPFQKQPQSIQKDHTPLASITFQQASTPDRTYRFDPPQGLHERNASHLKVTGSPLFSISIQDAKHPRPEEPSRETPPDLTILCGEEFHFNPIGEDVSEIVAGPLQGTTRQHTGVFGCSLIVVNEAKEIRHSFIPTQIFQREHLIIRQSAQMDQTLMMEKMQQQISSVKIPNNCQVLLCEWNLQGFDDVDRQSSPSRRRNWSQRTQSFSQWKNFSFNALTLPTRTVKVHHRFSASDELRLPQLVEKHQLAKEYLKLAEEFFPEEIEAFQEHLKRWASSMPPELASRMSQADPEKLIEFAVNYGTYWFVQAAEEVAA